MANLCRLSTALCKRALGAKLGELSASAIQTPIITRLSFNVPVDDVMPDVPQQIEKSPPKPVKKNKTQPVRQAPEKIAPVVKEPVIESGPEVEESESDRQETVVFKCVLCCRPVR